jgi:hypothetical protein
MADMHHLCGRSTSTGTVERVDGADHAAVDYIAS